MMHEELALRQSTAHDEVRTTQETTCCVVGAGPAGAVLALLLARRGVDVVLLEAHTDFDREFRGDTLHPAILEIIDEIGLAERLHELPHTKVYGPVIPTARGPIRPFDLRRLKTKFPYIMFMQQTIFLKFLTEEARKFPSFRLIMGASVQRLVEADGRVQGVCYKANDGWHEIRAPLTVGADGRFSRLRHLAGFEPIPTSETLELLQFRLPHLPDEPEEAKLLQQNADAPSLGVTAADFSSPIFPLFGQGRIVIVQNRSDHWQLWQIFPAGEYKQLRDAGVDSLRRSIVELEPRFAKHVEHLTDWQQVNLLSVASSRCRRWYKPGLLLIGDAAHTMTPAAGAGIKYAVEDAVVAVNLLAEPLKANKLEVRDLGQVQRQREWPTRFIQALSAVAVKQILRFVRSKGPPRFPLLARLLIRTPLVRYVAPRILAFGLWRVHVTVTKTPASQQVSLFGAVAAFAVSVIGGALGSWIEGHWKVVVISWEMAGLVVCVLVTIGGFFVAPLAAMIRRVLLGSALGAVAVGGCLAGVSLTNGSPPGVATWAILVGISAGAAAGAVGGAIGKRRRTT